SQPPQYHPNGRSYGGIYVSHRDGAEIEFRVSAGDVPVASGGYQMQHTDLESAEVVVHAETIALAASPPGVALAKATAVHVDGKLDAVGLSTEERRNNVELNGQDGTTAVRANKRVIHRVKAEAGEVQVTADQVEVLQNVVV